MRLQLHQRADKEDVAQDRAFVAVPVGRGRGDNESISAGLLQTHAEDPGMSAS